MNRIFVLLAAMLLSTPALAQQNAADQLTDQAKAAMVAEPARALTLATTAQQRAAAIPDPDKRAIATATALWLQSEALVRKRDAKAAAPRIAKALRLISGVTAPGTLRGDMLFTHAGVQQEQGKPAEAMATLHEAFKLFGAAGDKRKQAMMLQTIGSLYSEANDYASALRYFKQALEIYEGDPVFRWALLGNRGNALFQLNRGAEASAQFQLARRIAEQEGKDAMLLPVLVNLGQSLTFEKKFDEAEAVIRQAMQVAERLGEGATARPLAVAAELAYRRGDLQQARTLIERSFAGIDVANSPNAFRTAHLTAIAIYKALGEDALAFPHLERAFEMDDKTAELATSTSNALMAARFNYANQELRIANLKAEELRKAAQFQRTLFLGLGGATLIIITLLSVGLFTIRRSRNQVRAANIELNLTNVALEKALKAKTEFLATTSHEIRTPLNGILGMTQIMLRDPAVPAATRDRLGVVHGAGMTMRALVDDILDVAKMETGNLTVELTPTDLHATLRDVARMWEEQAGAKGVGFKLDLADAPRWIETDHGRLRQMLFNLLSNAVKFTEAGEIVVRAVQAGERLRIVIADSGIGIAADKHEEIFESFKQADSGTTRKFGGTGLGLAIVRNLARALSGEVTVSSVEGEGTIFTVDLPLRAIDAPAGADVAVEGGEAIVVLDKNPIARGMLRTLLAPKFAAVEFAATPDEAIDRLAEHGTAVLLVEEVTLKAVGNDPITALATLVERAKVSGARTAVLWARPDEAMLSALGDTGIDLTIAKPIAGPGLIDALLASREENDRRGGDGKLVSRAA